ncbi:MAG TPA: polyprenyl synthetase family protein, partial [Microbacterium sp.]|uniref:polyprenyl synthetase family protein n=1 Tax=Microbacterium sp. TaxID=51671 RepID=UPI002C73C90F
DATNTPALYPVAAAYELLHTALVVHDDVIDRDTVRRGIPNISGEFRTRASDHGADARGSALLGDTAGILAGDLLLHAAQRTIALAEVDDPTRRRLLDHLDDAVVVSAAGELADVEHAILDGAPDAILAATHDKTAVYSFCAPLRAGAALADADAESDAVLRNFGARLGLAYQLVDDLIGAFGSDFQAGRPEGADLRGAKKTPLIAFARDTGSWADVEGALAVAHTGPVALRRAQAALESSGARRRLQEMIHETIGEARAIIEAANLPEQARRMLRQLASAVEGRIP